MQDSLAPLRIRMNQLDAQLVELINARAATALEIGELKQKTGKQVYDPARERAVLEQIDKLNAGPLDKGALEDIFAGIINACREIQIQQL